MCYNLVLLQGGCMQYRFVFALAESFAAISNVESASYHYLYCEQGADASIYRKVLHDHFIFTLSCQGLINPYHADRLVDAALIEATHPITSGTKAWTVQDRCLATGIKRATWYRYKYDKIVDAIIKAVHMMSDRVNKLTQEQLQEYYSS